MRFGQLTEAQLSELSTQQITTIVYGDWKDNGDTYDVALLLGGKAIVCKERAAAAAYL